jgi:hypothetical protein
MFLLVAHRGFPPESKIACKTQRQATESVCERQLAGGVLRTEGKLLHPGFREAPGASGLFPVTAAGTMRVRRRV